MIETKNQQRDNDNNNEKNLFFTKDEIELLDGVDTLAREEQKNSIKTSFLIAALLLLLTIPYFLLGPQVFSIIEGKTQSTIVSKEITYKNWTVQFDEPILLELKTMYLTQSSFEFAACLQGTFDEEKYHFTTIYLPQIYTQAFEHVLFQSCPSNAIAMLHSHPYKHCIFSEQDIETYRRSKQANKNILMIVMCEENRFGFYRE